MTTTLLYLVTIVFQTLVIDNFYSVYKWAVPGVSEVKIALQDQWCSTLYPCYNFRNFFSVFSGHVGWLL